jgi:hypothetical protein
MVGSAAHLDYGSSWLNRCEMVTAKMMAGATTQPATHGFPQIAIAPLREHGTAIENESMACLSVIETPQRDIHPILATAGSGSTRPGIRSSLRHLHEDVRLVGRHITRQNEPVKFHYFRFTIRDFANESVISTYLGRCTGE